MRILILLVLAAIPALPQCGPAAVRKPIGNGQYSCVPKATVVQRTGTLTAGKVPMVDASGNVVDGPMSCSGGNCSIPTTLPGASTAAGTVAVWAKYTLTMSGGNWTVNGTAGAAQAGALTQQVALVTIPAKTVLHGIVIEHTTPFSGGTVASATVSVGTATSPTLLSDAYNVFQAITALPYQNGGLSVGRRTSATLALVVAVTTTVGNISALTAGSVDIYLLTSVLP